MMDISVMKILFNTYPYFFTATILEWKSLLSRDEYKEVIVGSLRFLVEAKRIRVYAFVIMYNHIHVIWQMYPEIDPSDVQRDFLKYTAQIIKADLRKHYPAVLELFKVRSMDRKYQFWERNALSIELRTPAVFLQKMNYIHRNPVKAKLVATPSAYKYSSALFYQTGKDNWGFLTRYRG